MSELSVSFKTKHVRKISAIQAKLSFHENEPQKHKLSSILFQVRKSLDRPRYQKLILEAIEGKWIWVQ